MKSIYWDKPVRIGGVMVFGPLAAQQFMSSAWPIKKDSGFGFASSAILAALKGRGSPDFAREQFEKALLSADLVEQNG